MQVPCLDPIDGLLAPCCVLDVVRGCGGGADILGETGCSEVSRGLWLCRIRLRSAIDKNGGWQSNILFSAA
jgi:hypothetical protein